MDAIVWACDESILSCNKYRRLAAVESCLIREYLIVNCRVEITNLINEKIRINTFRINKNEDSCENLNISEENNENIDNIIVDNIEIGNGVYRSIYTLLQNIIKIWKQSSFINPVEELINLDGDDDNNQRKKGLKRMFNKRRFSYDCEIEGFDADANELLCKIFENHLKLLKLEWIFDTDSWPPKKHVHISVAVHPRNVNRELLEINSVFGTEKIVEGVLQ
ncbi:hypothetical protein Glove_194g100 [Diversispora epigaea]|uniref:Uncharacterized protein n=1 Tax=Diversispora epigaea TaxID=1348612 RepID=A0A397IPN1_9GLOM|nr:hypothetical protein Glove_194g100 [Diversispora epigaea]